MCIFNFVCYNYTSSVTTVGSFSFADFLLRVSPLCWSMLVINYKNAFKRDGAAGSTVWADFTADFPPFVRYLCGCLDENNIINQTSRYHRVVREMLQTQTGLTSNSQWPFMYDLRLWALCRQEGWFMCLHRRPSGLRYKKTTYIKRRIFLSISYYRQLRTVKNTICFN